MSLFCINQINIKWTTMQNFGKFWDKGIIVDSEKHKNIYGYFFWRLLFIKRTYVGWETLSLNSLYKYTFLPNKHILSLMMPMPNKQMRKWYMITNNKYWTVLLLLSRLWVRWMAAGPCRPVSLKSCEVTYRMDEAWTLRLLSSCSKMDSLLPRSL